MYNLPVLVLFSIDRAPISMYLLAFSACVWSLGFKFSETARMFFYIIIIIIVIKKVTHQTIVYKGFEKTIGRSLYWLIDRGSGHGESSITRATRFTSTPKHLYHDGHCFFTVCNKLDIYLSRCWLMKKKRNKEISRNGCKLFCQSCVYLSWNCFFTIGRLKYNYPFRRSCVYPASRFNQLSISNCIMIYCSEINYFSKFCFENFLA